MMTWRLLHLKEGVAFQVPQLNRNGLFYPSEYGTLKWDKTSVSKFRVHIMDFTKLIQITHNGYHKIEFTTGSRKVQTH